MARRIDTELDLLLSHARAPLDRETELAVARRARDGDRRAREDLVLHNLGLVVSIARRFQCGGVGIGDLVQEGSLGLCKAIDRFDPERGHRFSTYAVWWVRAYLNRGLQRAAGAVHRQEPRSAHDVSLDETVALGSETTHLDLLADGGPAADEALGSAELQRQVRRALDQVRGSLGRVAWDIVWERLADDDPRTLEELGHRFGVSRERVRQIEQRARSVLGRHLAPFAEAA